IRLLIDHIVVEKDAITIKHIVPTDDNCRLLPGRRPTQMNADSGDSPLRFFVPLRLCVKNALLAGESHNTT
ncbi:hypothetical protein FKZ61_022210, partial [Litorilinea aerophila]|uniref:hypothetical protein n=1 Tax=Litorilinea aerophila TaxID=1204385 RepID=UPI001B86861D